MLIAALFTTAKKYKQSMCPLIDEWINKMWHNYAMKYYLAIKSIDMCCNMDKPRKHYAK